MPEIISYLSQFGAKSYLQASLNPAKEDLAAFMKVFNETQIFKKAASADVQDHFYQHPLIAQIKTIFEKSVLMI